MSLRSLTKSAGSGSGSVSQRSGSAYPYPYPYQNVTDPEHCDLYTNNKCNHTEQYSDRRKSQGCLLLFGKLLGYFPLPPLFSHTSVTESFPFLSLSLSPIAA